MINQIGNPVSGSNFFGRENEIKSAQYYLDRGNSIALFGLRRIGKSSLLQELAYKYEKNQNYTVIELDVEDYPSLSFFYEQVYSKLPLSLKEKTFQKLANLPTRIRNYLGVTKLDSVEFDAQNQDFRNYWEDISNSFQKILTGGDQKILLFIDELPFFLENLEKDNDKRDSQMILATLKAWRNKGVVMAIAGSIQIDHFLERLGLSSKLLAGLNRINVLAYSYEEALGLLQALIQGENKQIEDKLLHKAVDLLLDFVPIFIQYFAKEIIQNQPQTEADIKELYETKVLPKIESEFFTQFEERFTKLKKDIENGRATAERLFDELEEKSEIDNTALRKEFENYDEVRLRLLLDDFLIAPSHNKIRFSLNYVKFWWTQRKS